VSLEGPYFRSITRGKAPPKNPLKTQEPPPKEHTKPHPQNTRHPPPSCDKTFTEKREKNFVLGKKKGSKFRAEQRIVQRGNGGCIVT